MLDKNVDQNKTIAKKLGENYFCELYDIFLDC